MASTSPYTTPTAAASHLLAQLQAMGEAGSNAVLLLLDAVYDELPAEPPRLQQGQQYPADKLRFGQDRLRAYYHSHTEPWPRAGEHGHFHFFVPAAQPADGAEGTQAWAHLVALGMDQQGQPQRWFMVNHWVAGGAWQAPAALMAALQTALQQTPATVLEQWLLAMLGLYQPELESLLAERDRALQAAAGDRGFAAVAQDRALYQLASRDIDLAATLQHYLVPPTTSGHALNG